MGRARGVGRRVGRAVDGPRARAPEGARLPGTPPASVCSPAPGHPLGGRRAARLSLPGCQPAGKAPADKVAWAAQAGLGRPQPTRSLCVRVEQAAAARRDRGVEGGVGGGRHPPTHHPWVAPRAVKQRLGHSRRCFCGRVLWPGGGPSRAPRHVYVNAAGVAFFDAHSAAPVAFVCGLVSNCDLACINLFPFPASYFEYNA